MVTGEQFDDEELVEFSLRPQRLAQYIGQTIAKDNLAIFIEAAKLRNEPLDHVLLYGPPGLGKTTMASIIANEMNVEFRTTSGPAIERAGDLAAILSSLEVGDVLLISNNLAYAVIYNTKICDLIYPEELKMADHFEYEEDFETDDFDIKKNESEIYDENDDQMINSFEDLPVKIEFVLGKKIMNLYEIDDLCAKRIISLLPESEKNIEIRVNGALTGYGELVEVDDKLGVEIHSWLSGNNNVK